MWKVIAERQAISSSPCSQGTGQETSLNWLWWARCGLDLRKLSPVGAHHGNRLSRMTAGLPGQNKSRKHLAEQVWVLLVMPPCRMIACLVSRDLIQAFLLWLSDAITITFALPMCLYPQLETPTPKFMGYLSVHTIQSVVILLKVPAEMLASAICTLVLLASVYLQKNWDQLMHNMASDHYKKPETNQKWKESLLKKWLMMQQGSVKGHLDSRGIQSTVWLNEIAVHSWEGDLPRTSLNLSIALS